jgi:hypothetical protein
LENKKTLLPLQPLSQKGSFVEEVSTVEKLISEKKLKKSLEISKTSLPLQPLSKTKEVL